MKGMLVVGLVIIGVVVLGLLWTAAHSRVNTLARVRRRDNVQLRQQLLRANQTIIAVKGKVDDIGELNPVLANAIRPLVDGYLIDNGRNVR